MRRSLYLAKWRLVPCCNLRDLKNLLGPLCPLETPISIARYVPVPVITHGGTMSSLSPTQIWPSNLHTLQPRHLADRPTSIKPLTRANSVSGAPACHGQEWPTTISTTLYTNPEIPILCASIPRVARQSGTREAIFAVDKMGSETSIYWRDNGWSLSD